MHLLNRSVSLPWNFSLPCKKFHNHQFRQSISKGTSFFIIFMHIQNTPWREGGGEGQTHVYFSGVINDNEFLPKNQHLPHFLSMLWEEGGGPKKRSILYSIDEKMDYPSKILLQSFFNWLLYHRECMLSTLLKRAWLTLSVVSYSMLLPDTQNFFESFILKISHFHKENIIPMPWKWVLVSAHIILLYFINKR